MTIRIIVGCGVKVDIGLLLKDCKDDREAQEVLNKLSESQKHELLTSHVKPNKDIEKDAKSRRFLLSWFDKYSWLAYSFYASGAFCLPCAIFASFKCNRGKFVTKAFQNLKKFIEKANEHSGSKYHLEAVDEACTFLQQRDNPKASVIGRQDGLRQRNVEKNRHILKWVIKTVLHCARQCISLRGDKEVLNSSMNPGNFLATLQLLGENDQILRDHLSSPEMKNAKMTSPRIQNEVLELLAQHYIVSQLIEEIKRAKYYSIMADEVTTHNSEVLSLCIRFVDSSNEIREEFLTFSKVQRITGESLATEIQQILQSKGLDMAMIRGQGYDGASNMASKISGVQARVKAVTPLAVYVHCSSHALNLVIARACKLTEVKYMIDKLQSVCLFFENSPKRNEALKSIVLANVPKSSRRKALLDLCQTRWTARHEAYTHFYQSFKYVVEALECMAYGLHLDEYEILRDKFPDWDYHTKNDATSLLKAITDFTFIATFCLVYMYLAHLQGITVQLQSSSLDVLDAYAKVIFNI